MQCASFDAERRLAQRLHALVPSSKPHAQVLSNQRVARGFCCRAPRPRVQRSLRSPRQRSVSRRGPTTRAKLVKRAHVRLRLHVHLHERVRHGKQRRRTRRKLLLADGSQQAIRKSEGNELGRFASLSSSVCGSLWQQNDKGRADLLQVADRQNQEGSSLSHGNERWNEPARQRESSM